MTYKQFIKWCNERTCDGQWSMITALTCINVIKTINKVPFWKRENEWQKLNKDLKIEEIYVNETNKLIKKKEVSE